jgi:hypothetical protein
MDGSGSIALYGLRWRSGGDIAPKQKDVSQKGSRNKPFSYVECGWY